MARTDERFRETFNALLDECSAMQPGAHLPAELVLSARFDASRTIIRSVLERMSAVGLVHWRGREKILLRKPLGTDRLPVTSSLVPAADLEREFLNWILRFDVSPGTSLNVAELARRFRVSTYGIQEFLASLSRFGLVRRGPKYGWELLGFTPEFAVELSDFRMMIEPHAVAHVVALPSTHPIWETIQDLERDHLELANEIDARYQNFARLDERFHAAIGGVMQNRFVNEFQKVISLIFHYRYQWDKRDERERNATAIGEHLRIIAALKQSDAAAAIEAVKSHLRTSKRSLLISLRS